MIFIPRDRSNHCMLDYTPIPTYEFIYSMVLSVTSRVFVGRPLAYEQAWLDTVSGYLAEVVATANALRPWPSVLRPLVRHFVAPKHRMDTILTNAEKLLVPAIQERQEREKQTDMLGFLVQTSEAVDPKAVILRLLILTAAAVCPPTFIQISIDLMVSSYILQPWFPFTRCTISVSGPSTSGL